MKNIKFKFKVTHIVFSIIIALLVVLVITLYNFLIPSYTQEELYGKRLEGIYETSDSDLKSLENYYLEPEFASKANLDVKGLVIYIIVEVEGVTIEEVQAGYPIGLSEAEINSHILNSYDLNVTFINDTEEVGEDGKNYFPIVAYRNKKNTTIKWQSKHLWEYNENTDEEESGTEDDSETSE